MSKKAKNKHKPIRTCRICRTKMEKSLLERYVLLMDSKNQPFYALDQKKTMPGRGCYVCQSPECQKRLLKYGLRGIRVGGINYDQQIAS